MEFKQLEAFVAVVENKSFSEAARQLNLTQPTISAHINSLEQELNSRLLIRTTKKLNITQRGLLLYDCASNMLNMRSNIIEEFTGQNKKIIDLAVSTIPSSYLLPGILSAFTCQIPDVYFHSWQSDSLGAVARVLDGSVDLALVGNTFDEPDCCFIPFCKDKLVIATPVNQHYLQYQQKMDSGTLDFSDFLREPFIMRETGSGTKKEIDRYLEKRNIPASSLHIVARMNDLEAIRKSVAGGLGISILSACSAKDLADTHQILMFPLNHESAMRTFYIVYSKNRILKPHVKQFLKFVTIFIRACLKKAFCTMCVTIYGRFFKHTLITAFRNTRQKEAAHQFPSEQLPISFPTYSKFNFSNCRQLISPQQSLQPLSQSPELRCELVLQLRQLLPDQL